jgi:hypothetical protein
MNKNTKNSKTITKSIEEINKLEITRKIIDNGTMQRLNLPSEIVNLKQMANKIKVETEIDFEAMTITWKPRIKEVKFIIE